LEKFDYSLCIQDCIGSIIEEISEKEIQKIPIIHDKIQGTSLISQKNDGFEEIELEEFSFLILENKEDIKKMDLSSIRQEIYHKTDLFVMEKKKNIFSVINSLPSKKITNPTNDYIDLLRELKRKRGEDLVIMTDPRTSAKIVREVMSSKENQKKVRKALAEMEDE
jgi:hypothetical protein